MKYAIIIACVFFHITQSLAQIKPTISQTDLLNWPEVLNPKISNNGSYAMFTIINKPSKGSTLFLRSINAKWERIIINVKNAEFTPDNKMALVLMSNDSLFTLTLGNSETEYIGNVKSYRLFINNKNCCIAYYLKGSPNSLNIRLLNGKSLKTIENVSEYYIAPNGLHIICQRSLNNESKLIWYNLLNNKETTIWKGLGNCSNIIFDNFSNQIAFISLENQTSNNKSIWYYKLGESSANNLINNNSDGIRNNLAIGIGRTFRFSNDGRKIFFCLKNTSFTSNENSVKITIWSYLDPKLQGWQKYEQENLSKANLVEDYLSVFDIKKKQVITLINDNERIIAFNEKKDSILLIEVLKGSATEYQWNENSRQNTYLLFTNTGERHALKLNATPFLKYLAISPDFKYTVFYDPEFKNYFCYKIKTGETVNITASVKTLWSAYSTRDFPAPDNFANGLCGWINNSNEVLIRDRFDIWKIDLEGKLPPVNLTYGIGIKNKIEFSLAYSKPSDIHNKGSQIILAAFDHKNKMSGYYRLELTAIPKLISLGLHSSYFDNGSIIKAKNQTGFLLLKESSIESKNCYSTTDFKHFTALSYNSPERNFNWYTTELHTWINNEDTFQGILYKPEDFDIKKKYPVVLLYYDKLSDRLNNYEKPDANGSTINIPFFVSSGYLVFTPDIHFKIGKTGESALSTINSAADYLSTFSWINGNKLAVHGHSFGGFETNYIITHSNRFAAAISAAGISDFISEYGSLWSQGDSKHLIYELGANRIGASMWETPNAYIENSPILKANKVTTPVLLMHNKNDGAVPFSQSMEFFSALRRLKKKAWLLEYDNEGHIILNKNAAIDYQIRMKQFLDHFLKDYPEPLWISQGIPYKTRGSEDGLRIIQ